MVTKTFGKLKLEIHPGCSAAGHAAGTAAAAAVRDAIAARGSARVIFAAAPSQNETLATLAAASGIDWRRVTAFHMDEYFSLASGATLFTHLGNAVPAMLPLHSNPVWSQLADDRLAVSLVGDGFHLPREVFQTMLKAKGENAFLVSDCTCFAGMSPGRYRTRVGGDVVLTPEGRLHLAADERLLAGSAFSLRLMVDFLTSNGWAAPGTIREVATTRPLKFLGLSNSQFTIHNP